MPIEQRPVQGGGVDDNDVTMFDLDGTSQVTHRQDRVEEEKGSQDSTAVKSSTASTQLPVRLVSAIPFLSRYS